MSKFSFLSEIPCTGTPPVLNQLEQTIVTRCCAIETWFRKQWRDTPPPFYASVDLRNSGFKLAPIDTNLFPAGFNNLDETCIPLAIVAAQDVVEKLIPNCSNILLIPEDHTRNRYYFENLAVLRDILQKAGFTVRIGSSSKEFKTTKRYRGLLHTITIEPVIRDHDRVVLNDFDPCVILLNHDLANGIPELLKDIRQPIIPAVQLGWHQRLKSQHFAHYRTLAREFAEYLGFDPWLIQAFASDCDHVDLVNHADDDRLIQKTKVLLDQIQAKYQQYQISCEPYAVIKADSGTYGLGVLTIDDPEQLRNLNRKKRMKMASTKGNRPIGRVLLQEGVYTAETWHGATAEPVVYLLGQHVVGGFYRVHRTRNNRENLNSPGMRFESMPFTKACNTPEQTQFHRAENRFYVYGVIARLAVLAAARESIASPLSNRLDF